MKDGLYEACDFNGFHLAPPAANATGVMASIANHFLPQLREQWLAQLLRGAPVVYGEPARSLRWSPIAHTQQTHTARLIDIREIGGVK